MFAPDILIIITSKPGAMEAYSPAFCTEDPAKYHILSWEDFFGVMHRRGAVTAAFVVTHVRADFTSLADRSLIARLVIAVDGVRHMESYCLADHSRGGLLMPCIVLLDATCSYALSMARQFNVDVPVLLAGPAGDGRFQVSVCA